MARIRSIKPEFWADDNMLDLSDSCALFYVSLWNFCDDEGKIENKPRSISKLVCRWSEAKVKMFIKTLVTSGRLRINKGSTWLQVENWSHQKIDKPKQPKVLSSELQWITNNTSSNDQVIFVDESTQGEDRIGKESTGMDSGAHVEFVADDSKKAFDSTIVIPAEQPLPKDQLIEMILTDEIYIENLQMTHRGKDIKQAFNECYIHHSNAPNPPKDVGAWKQKLNTWLSNTKYSNGTSPKARGDTKQSRREGFAKRHSSDA